MADVHECEDCGMMCDCDGEDMHNPQPPDCMHLAGPGYCDVEEYGEEGESAQD